MQRRFDIFAANCNVSLINDYSKLKELISVMNSDIVFCHNDLLVHNIVYCENTGEIDSFDTDIRCSGLLVQKESKKLTVLF